jgi:hypothetical protein
VNCRIKYHESFNESTSDFIAEVICSTAGFWIECCGAITLMTFRFGVEDLEWGAGRSRRETSSAEKVPLLQFHKHG